MLVWARALVFSKLNDLPLLMSPWAQLMIGPILRRETDKRFYQGVFYSQGPLTQLKRLWLERILPCVDEPDIARRVQDHAPKSLYRFSQIPHWSDYFAGVHQHRDLIKRELLSMVVADYRRMAEILPAPVVAVHIRRGDFRELQPGEDFSRVGLVRTPLDYFRSQITTIHAIAGKSLPVTIFSDAKEGDLDPLLSLPDVGLATGNPAVVDMLLMSRSKVIILSAGSTFGMWAGFLSNAAVVHHPQHFHIPTRDEETNQMYFEGYIDPSCSSYPALLVQNICAG